MHGPSNERDGGGGRFRSRLESRRDNCVALKSATSHAIVITPVRVTPPAQTETKMIKFLSSVESLKSFFEWSSVGLLALTFVAGAGVVITSRIVNKRQEETIIGLQKSASDAKTAQQQVEISLADAKTKQADAEKELLALKQRVMREKLPRWARLQPLGEYVTGKPAGIVEIVFVPEDGEAQKTALGIEAHLSADGKWKLLRNARPISSNEESLLLPQYATPKMRDNPFHMPFIERIGLLSDITVVASPDDLSDGFPKEGTAVHALWKGLHSCGFETLANSHSGLPAGTARVVVGTKQ